MPVRNDKPVMVCAACLTAACWYGEFMCDSARSATTTVKTAGELRALGREHPSYWSAGKFAAIYGTPNPDFAVSLLAEGVDPR